MSDPAVLAEHIRATWFGSDLPQASLERLGMLAREYEAPARTRLLREGDSVSSIAVRIDRTRSDALFRQLKLHPRVATVASKTAMLQNFRETTARNLLFFTAVLTAFAAVIAIGVVYNTARIALQERAWELASLRVLGMTRAEISYILLGELALLALSLAIVLAFIRLVRGPSLMDRVTSLELIASLVAGIVAVYAIGTDAPALIDVAIALALVAFIGAVAFARYAELRERP